MCYTTATMNIFATYSDPVKCAEVLDDIRLNKMLTETSQILSTSLHMQGLWQEGLCKPHNPGHPLMKWPNINPNNLNWLYAHFVALGNEYTFRTGKVQKSTAEKLPIIVSILNKKDDFTTAFVSPIFGNHARNTARGVDYSHIADTNLAYRLYLDARWKMDTIKLSWAKRKRPTLL